MIKSDWLDLRFQSCERDAASFMSVVLQKADTTPHERMVAQTMQAPIRLPDDPVPASAMHVPDDGLDAASVGPGRCESARAVQGV
jgi:hypothetical protein